MLVKMPEVGEAPSQPLELAIVARTAERSGRPVERRLKRVLAPTTAMIGIKPNFDDVLAEESEAQFDLMSTKDDMPVRWTFNCVGTQYQ